MLIIKNRGQATVEFILLIAFSITLTLKSVSIINEFLGDSVGNIGHELSMNLRVGVCKENCFFSGYINGHGN